MVKLTQSWFKSETMQAATLVLAAMLAIGIVKGDLSTEGWVAATLALLAGFIRIVKGKDE